MHAIRFPILFVRYAVVADKWIRHYEDLPGIGGIGEALRVASHAGGKDRFTRSTYRSTKAYAFKF